VTGKKRMEKLRAESNNLIEKLLADRQEKLK